ALLGIVPQEIALYDALSARQNLEFFGKMQDKGGAELKGLVDEVVEFIDLRERQNDKINTFSGGMKRRVNIAVGLLHHPQLLFMDEPTVGIDPQNRRRVLDMVRRLRDELNMTILYTSHLMEEVQEISDRVAIMDHGEVIALGTVGELIQSAYIDNARQPCADYGRQATRLFCDRPDSVHGHFYVRLCDGPAVWQ
ncbi:ABC transporter ATP-binding protein, partial [candidate division KSB1 bacterium]|nr:ABC transporter ATP-binding protein [candidate division KSB1 bacterium]